MYERFGVNERIQHVILMASFFVLMITGFSLMFPYSIWTLIVIKLFGGFYLRGIIHRLAALVFIGLGVYHLIVITFTRRGRHEVKELLPGLKDFTDVFQMMKYYLGFDKKRAQFGRYSYMEKAEYWALIWGSAVMIVTGIMLWAATQTIGLFGKLGFDIARVVHGYEAVLASLALIVWHFYYVIYNPDDFVFKNLTWIHGNISRERMHQEHPLELEKIEKKRQSKLFRPD